MDNSPMLHLKNAHFEVALQPACGGAIRYFRSVVAGKTIDWLRPSDAKSCSKATDVLQLAAFSLFPFSNRIANNQLTVDEHHYPLDSNVNGWPQIIHGHAWLGQWRVVDADEHKVKLAFSFPHDSTMTCGWPFAYEAEQTFELVEEGLVVTLKITNTSNQTVPVGMGYHPYFPLEEAMMVQLNTKGIWLTDKAHIPLEHHQEHGAIEALNLGTLPPDLDHNFTHWDGKAQLYWPSHGGRLNLTASDLFRNLVVFSPSEEVFFCLEPVTHTTNSFNHPDLPDALGGTQMLAPNESMQGDIRFYPSIVRAR